MMQKISPGHMVYQGSPVFVLNTYLFQVDILKNRSPLDLFLRKG